MHLRINEIQALLSSTKNTERWGNVLVQHIQDLNSIQIAPHHTHN